MNQPLSGSTVFVTGANGGIGEHFVREALERGAAKVYAAARTPRDWGDDRIVPVAFDLLDPASIAAAVSLAGDVTVLVNNAGIAPSDDNSISTEDEEIIRRVFETNFFGTLRTAKAFAPVLAANGGGSIVNVLSAAAWISVPTAYAASKAALLSASNSMRVELRGSGTNVVNLLMGMVDTPMGARWDVPKVSPASVVAQTYDGVESGAFEVLADDDTKMVKSLLSGSLEDFQSALDPALAAFQA